MAMITCKFGGSSLADASCIKKVKDILDSDRRRTSIVVSAPGKRFKDDIKVTDLLYRSLDDPSAFAIIEERFLQMAQDLGVTGFQEVLNQTFEAMKEENRSDYSASRGEYLNARLISAYLGFTYIEASELVDIDNFRPRKKLGEGLYCMGGFYGTDKDGVITTFSRGGSDISGSILARATDSELYENFTDVSGVYEADPRLIPGARPIARLSYEQTQRLGSLGAGVFHPSAIIPLVGSNIPIRVKNTMAPEDPGTLIEENEDSYDSFTPIGLTSTHNHMEEFGHQTFPLYAGLVYQSELTCALEEEVGKLCLASRRIPGALIMGLEDEQKLREVFKLFFGR